MPKVKVDLLADDTVFERVFRRASKTTGHFAESVNKTSKETLKGHGVFRSLGKAVAFGTGGFIAYEGVKEALIGSVEAAQQAAVVEHQLRTQFNAAGKDLDHYKKRIDSTTLSLSGMSGFTQVDLLKAFTTLFRATGDVNKSLKLTALAANIARGRHMDLGAATLATTKAALGSATAFKRLGIEVIKSTEHTDAAKARIAAFRAEHKKLTPEMKAQFSVWLQQAKAQDLVASSQDTLALATKKFAGQAQAGTSIQDRFGASLHNTEVTIGTALLPTVNKYLGIANNWLSQSKNQRTIQHDVNQALKTATTVIHGVEAVVVPLGHGIKQLNSFLGGTKHTTELLTAAFVAFKLKGILGLVGPIGKLAKALGLLNAAEGGTGLPSFKNPKTAGKDASGVSKVLKKFPKIGPVSTAAAVVAASGYAIYHAAKVAGKTTPNTKGGGGATNRVSVPVKGGQAFLVGARGQRLPVATPSAKSSGDVHIHGDVIVHNPTGADDFIKQLQKKAKHHSHQTRGRHGGTRLGIH